MKVRELLADDLGHDRLGVEVQRKGAELYLAYPIVIVVGEVPRRCG